MNSILKTSSLVFLTIFLLTLTINKTSIINIEYFYYPIYTEWFSILEFDDEYSSKWFKNVVKYKEAHTDVDVFMPIIIDINEKDGGFMGLTNEAVWTRKYEHKSIHVFYP